MDRSAQVLKTDDRFFQHLVQANLEGLTALLAEDFVLIDVMRGDEISKAALLEVIRSHQLRFLEISPSERRVRFYGDMAVVTGRTAMTGQFGSDTFTVKSRYTHLFVERDARWQFVSAHGTQSVET
jgi:ketosteroid isomerase-like protein